MTTQFFNRYIPPINSALEAATKIEKENESTPVPEKQKKRKRIKGGDAKALNEDREREGMKKKQKQRGERKVKRKVDVLKEELVPEEEEEEEEEDGKNKNKRMREKKMKEDREGLNDTTEKVAGQTEDQMKPEKNWDKNKNKKRTVNVGGDETNENLPSDSPYSLKDEEDVSPSKEHTKNTDSNGKPDRFASGHSLIIQKLRRSLALAKAAPIEPANSLDHVEPAANNQAPAVAPIIATGLQPLPQPEPTKPSKPIPSLSSLPSWLQKPITISPTTKIPFSSIKGLSCNLQERLSSKSFTKAFAVQAAVLPLLLNRKKFGDLCISAATGSGKTLAYVLPIIQSLSSRTITRLRAIIIVPTRELVHQVYNTTTSISVGTGLKIGVAIGSRSVLAEQGLLVLDTDGGISSRIDILVTTPGRLVEHIRTTSGFELGWVRWLVIDEADRLLSQSFQEWVDVVIVGLEKAVAGNRLERIANVNLGDLGLRQGPRATDHVQKVVLSATMTKDLGKLAGLRLRKPSLVMVEDPPLPEGAEADNTDGDGNNEELERFSIPMGLKEHVTPVENIEYKPLYLLYLLRLQEITTGALVFVKSNENAARLAKLLETIGEESTASKWSIGLVTGEMEKKRRERVLRRFAKGEVDL
jgi:ATP-dependent RNA helicase DDX51/DBP6